MGVSYEHRRKRTWRKRPQLTPRCSLGRATDIIGETQATFRKRMANYCAIIIINLTHSRNMVYRTLFPKGGVGFTSCVTASGTARRSALKFQQVLYESVHFPKRDVRHAAP